MRLNLLVEILATVEHTNPIEHLQRPQAKALQRVKVKHVNGKFSQKRMISYNIVTLNLARGQQVHAAITSAVFVLSRHLLCVDCRYTEASRVK